MQSEDVKQRRKIGPVAPVLEPGHTYASVTDKISSIVLTRRTPIAWFIGFAISFALLMVFMVAVTWLFIRGVGIWGINVPVAWGFAIVNFVWWIGIGHAGTLISAILLLLRQQWRTSINRFAEAMTLFAVACAGLFPVLHLGRPWLAYWLAPYPNTMGLWPQWRSPLIWDFFAVSTYATVSLLFWYIGLIPDLATLRDRARRRATKVIYGMLALGWRGSARHWHRYEMAYLLLAGLATPLVVSVHTIVSFDFAVGIVPGWHSTIFPPYFVAGALFQGFAMVLTITIPLRAFYGLKDFITARHLDNMGRILLATGLVVAYGYFCELCSSFYSGNQFESYMMHNRQFGSYWPAYWALIATNIVTPQLLWFQRVRLNVRLLWCIAMVVNVGMWLERYVIVVVSLTRDFVPGAWNVYHGTWWDVATYVGTLGLFATLIFLFIRVLPVISIFEMRELVSRTEGEHEEHAEPPRPAPRPAPSAAD
jgi:molybdopterin-containing oxidoreductase family membrane subunit